MEVPIRKKSRSFETAANSRAVKLDADSELAVDAPTSLETQDLAESDVLHFVKNNFKDFHRLIQQLSAEDQSLLLGYYVLAKTQAQLAVVLQTTQTICSAKIRAAIHRLCFLILCGPPTLETLKAIFESAGLEHGELKVPLSEVVMLYAGSRSFAEVASQLNLRRPDVRRVIRFAAKTLRESKDRREIATGAYLSGLFDEAPALPRDRSMSEEEQLQAPRVKLSEIFGQFRIDVSHPDFHQLFTPRGKP